MEEAKAAAYYEELTRKGEGAAKFKQGLGFSSSSSPSNRLPSQPSPSSSLFSNFIRASSPSKATELQKQAQLEKIQNKLRSSPDRGHRRGDRERDQSIHRHRHREDEEAGRRERHRDRESSHRRSRRSRSRSRSPSRDRHRGHKREKSSLERMSLKKKKKTVDVDYAKLIVGYDEMTPAERVKAKMKLQLSQTAAKDTGMGMSIGWERFDFNKDAPLDGDDEIEEAEDDSSVVKVMGKSFRSSAAEAKHEEEVKAAHDQAMFGAPVGSPVLPDITSNQEAYAPDFGEENIRDVLISDEVFALQQGSWRDRVRRFQSSSGS